MDTVRVENEASEKIMPSPHQNEISLIKKSRVNTQKVNRGVGRQEGGVGTIMVVFFIVKWPGWGSGSRNFGRECGRIWFGYWIMCIEDNGRY
jgi:hypothetical protein